MLIATDAPEVTSPAWARAQRVGRGRWRVTDRSGRILGHVHALAADAGWRFAAERYVAATRSFRRLGEFWSAEQALECLRYSR
jgi:hypothetical protein